MDWKINRDYFYKELFELGGTELIKEAGFFEDSSTEDYDITKSINVLCTPISFIRKKVKNAANPCVLIYTGSFCPIHDGHIQTMVQAKKAVEEQGYDVIGGYFSPGHDEYINSKVKDKAIPAYHRIKLINESIKDIDWLAVDPWEALFCKVAVNFTDVVYRLQLYLNQHLEKEITVFFVCGSDNARFAVTFSRKGNCVVVSRPGYYDRFNQYKHYSTSVWCKNRIIFCNGESDLSSTKIRETFEYVILKKNLELRMDHTSIEEREIKYLLQEQFLTTTIHDITEQKKNFKSFSALPKAIISLDSIISADHNLQISRKYDLFGTNLIDYTKRPGAKSLAEQTSLIEPGEYYLFDDDIHTGNTMRFAKNILEINDIKISGFISFIMSKTEDTEVLDCRDFIIGDTNSGLCIELPNNSITRVPYVYPYVCPYNRASILDPMKFSIELWKINMSFYKNKNCLLKEYPHLQIFKYIGFTDNSDLYDICKWHYNYLKEIANV